MTTVQSLTGERILHMEVISTQGDDSLTRTHPQVAKLSNLQTSRFPPGVTQGGSGTEERTEASHVEHYHAMLLFRKGQDPLYLSHPWGGVSFFLTN